MSTPPVAIIMGSQSDWPTMKHAADILDELGIPYDARIVSAHRTPDRMYDFAKGATISTIMIITVMIAALLYVRSTRHEVRG